MNSSLSNLKILSKKHEVRLMVPVLVVLFAGLRKQIDEFC